MNDLHLGPRAIEDAIGELKRTGASSVYPVSMGVRHARKLGLA